MGLRAPALAVAGELDEKYMVLSRRMEGLTPSVENAVVPGVGHSVHTEISDEYVELLIRFLSDVALNMEE